MIFISTGQYNSMTIDESLKYFLENGITNVELSGGQHDPNIVKL